MLCRKCKKEIPDNSIFCNFCGTKQDKFHSVKKRGNGQGSVFKLPNGKWQAAKTLEYSEDETGKIKRKTITKSTFTTKKDALVYLPFLVPESAIIDKNITFKKLYEEFIKIHEQKVGNDTMNCYKSAYKYYSDLYYLKFATIKTEHFQSCIDNCTKGKRTKENMKTLGGLLCKHAMTKDLINKNYASFTYVTNSTTTEREAFSQKDIDTMFKLSDKIPNLKYILVLIYTGLRIGELLNAKTENYNTEEKYFIAGSKTAAGKNRVIPISPKIWPYFKDFGKGEYLFSPDGKKLPEKKFRNDMYYAALESAKIDCGTDGNRKMSPHCCRHTFATLMKNVFAPATDKQKIIGHSKFEMTAFYTHTDIESLRKITDKI